MKWSCGFQLRVRSGPSRGNTYVVDAPVLKIGRAIRPGERVPGWVRLSDDTVSRLHCELFWQEDRQCFRLLHRSSTNSTYVNGEEVEDAEVFDGDLLELGSTSLELQKADLRWSKTPGLAVKEWAEPPPAAPVPAPIELETRPITGHRKIPGATVPMAQPTYRRLAVGPLKEHYFESDQGDIYLLKGLKLRFGAPQVPQVSEQEEKKPKITFNKEYEFADQGFSFYNLVLMYDELVQHYKAARVGPDSRKVRVFRKQGDLVWQTELPEGVELPLMEGDHLQMGELILAYKKRDKPRDE